MQLVLQIDEALVRALGKGLFQTKDGGRKEGSDGKHAGVNGAFDGVGGRGRVVDRRRGLTKEHAQATGQAFEAEEVVPAADSRQVLALFRACLDRQAEA